MRSDDLPHDGARSDARGSESQLVLNSSDVGEVVPTSPVGREGLRERVKQAWRRSLRSRHGKPSAERSRAGDRAAPRAGDRAAPTRETGRAPGSAPGTAGGGGKRDAQRGEAGLRSRS